MPLPECRPRRPLHHRNIHFEGFIRDDGLWEVEGFLLDRKPFEFRTHQDEVHCAGQAVHDLSVRVTLNDALEIVDICASMDAVPFGSCHPASESVRALIGCTVGAGWKETVRSKLPRTYACTHLSELLVTLATAVFQTQGFGKQPEGSSPLLAMRRDQDRPFFVDRCLSWRTDGALVRKVFPMHYRPSPGQTP